MPRTITIAAIYSPPRHVISSVEYEDFLLHFGPHFLLAGDWNAKHITWGSRLTTPKGRNLLHVIQNNNHNYLSTGEPTYWPADLKKSPELLDFAITNGISGIYSTIESSLDLESDHSPNIITLSINPIWKIQPLRLCNKYTNWKQFQDYINKNITHLKYKTKRKHRIGGCSSTSDHSNTRSRVDNHTGEKKINPGNQQHTATHQRTSSRKTQCSTHVAKY